MVMDEILPLVALSVTVEGLVAPQFIVSPAGKPHIFIALEDSLILEWTGLGKFQKELYAPYREIIEARKKGQVIKK